MPENTTRGGAFSAVGTSAAEDVVFHLLRSELSLTLGDEQREMWVVAFRAGPAKRANIKDV